MNALKIALASDHAGYEQKQAVLKHLTELNINFKDFGAFSSESSDYADYAHPLAEAVESGDFECGISLCGSGNGITMTVNKHQGIRAALCWIPEIAALAKKHNNANIISLPARYITDEQAIQIVDAYLNETFEGGRHINRIIKIPVN